MGRRATPPRSRLPSGKKSSRPKPEWLCAPPPSSMKRGGLHSSSRPSPAHGCRPQSSKKRRRSRPRSASSRRHRPPSQRSRGAARPMRCRRAGRPRLLQCTLQADRNHDGLFYATERLLNTKCRLSSVCPMCFVCGSWAEFGLTRFRAPAPVNSQSRPTNPSIPNLAPRPAAPRLRPISPVVQRSTRSARSRQLSGTPQARLEWCGLSSRGGDSSRANIPRHGRA